MQPIFGKYSFLVEDKIIVCNTQDLYKLIIFNFANLLQECSVYLV